MSARYERKFILSPSRLRMLEQRLRAALRLDSYCQDGPYHVRSIYLDGPKHPAVWEKISGTSPRRKYRVRFYNRNFSQAKLECKMKRGDLITKRSLSLSSEQFANILNQRRTKPSNDPLLRQFQLDQRQTHLKPQVAVDYFRLAFVHPTGNCRITLDTQLAAGRWHSWKSPQHMPSRVMDHSAILELKYTDHYPQSLDLVLPNPTSPQLAISKYVLCYGQLAQPLRGF